ncbi:MAG: flagellar biosynthetic protein FliO [Rubrivivax sp.]
MTGFVPLLWFAAVVAAIPLALWLLRRSGVAGTARAAAGAPRTVSVLALSPSQRLVTVEVGQGEERLWLVLGVTAQSIRTLHTMSAQSARPPAGLADAAGAPAATFAQLLGRMRRQPGGDAQ